MVYVNEKKRLHTTTYLIRNYTYDENLFQKKVKKICLRMRNVFIFVPSIH